MNNNLIIELQKLQVKIAESQILADKALSKLKDVATDSHLKNTLTMIREDVRLNSLLKSL